MFEIFAFSIILSIKFLLFPTYHSTDFEVHRNWKAITTSLSIREWYFNDFSEWTLDYPPLFAYMELILGYISKLFDPQITNIHNLYYSESLCKYFMRCTVLIGDIIFFLSMKKISKVLKIKKKFILLFISIEGFAGLVLIDNIHFQYNGILFGIFFMSIGYVINEEYIIGAILFTICLCMKHIFLYMAPAYFVFYLKFVIFQDSKNFFEMIKKTIKIGCFILLIIFLTFLPFILISIKDRNLNQFIQIKERLFPFKRGLIHTYWAPNFWAIYSFLDKILYWKNKLNNINDDINKINNQNNINIKKNTSTLGKTQETNFDVLPDISSKISNIIVLSNLLIYFVKNIFKDNKKNDKLSKGKILIKYCLMSNLIFFNFGYHVHEKAFIIISLLSIVYFIISEKKDILTNFNFLFILIGSLSQFPLIFQINEYLIKIGILLFYLIFSLCFLNNNENKNILYKILIISYILICLILDFNNVFKEYINNIKLSKENISFGLGIFIELLNKIQILNNRYPFLSLMCFSVLNAILTQIIYFILLIFF